MNDHPIPRHLADSSREVPDIPQTCCECGLPVKNRRGLAMHIVNRHSMQLDEYLLKWKYKGVTPLCMCGCGKHVSWHHIKKHFNDYCRGHNTKTGVEEKRFGFMISNNQGDKEPIYTRDSLIKKHLSDPNGKAHTENVVLPELLNALETFVEKNGWFYPPLDKTPVGDVVKKIHDSIQSPPRISSITNIGNDWLKSRFKSFWNVLGGPAQSFNNKRVLSSVLKYRLGLNTSIDYNYTLDTGENVTTNEHFDITFSNIRRGFIVRRNAVSWFKPIAAASIWRALIDPGTTRPRVWDPSAGFGARQLGMLSAFNDSEYIATEPASETFRDNVALSHELMEVFPTFSSKIIQEGSESPHLDIEPESLHAVFTSPPYFDREKYFNEPTQCWAQYKGSEAWGNGYLYKTFLNAHKFLRPDGKMAINVYDELREIVVTQAERAGFELLCTWELNYKNDHFSKTASSKSGNNKLEPILVFKKKVTV